MYKRKDAFYVRAKRAGYRSRAAYKLEELATRSRLFRRGDCVVDLGAWPGGWLQVAAQHVGPTGTVIGVDLQSLEPFPDKNIILVTGDITSDAMQQRVAELCGGHADVLLSDLAPKLTGVRARDAAQARVLADAVSAFAERLLRPGGRLVMKLFMNDDVPRLKARLQALFREVRTTRPEATRKGSAEIYAVASDFRALRTS